MVCLLRKTGKSLNFNGKEPSFVFSNSMLVLLLASRGRTGVRLLLYIFGTCNPINHSVFLRKQRNPVNRARTQNIREGLPITQLTLRCTAGQVSRGTIAGLQEAVLSLLYETV